MIKYLIPSIVIGGALTEVMRRVTLLLIRNRAGETQNRLIAGKFSAVFWILAGAALCGLTAVLIPNPIVLSISIMCMMLVLISLSVIDADIRKIPNSLLIALLVIKAAAIFAGGDMNGFTVAFWGFGLGAGLLLVSLFLPLGFGMGDLKLIAVMGFCLGIIGLLQAVAIMGIVMGIYTIILLITRKGGLKTKAALGPPLSLGMAITLLLPMTDIILKK
ncbi:MAG: Type IV leader peptidase family protein [Firmicutes bacterium ADurb.Bin182]|nr:MAG: Type IV leader peptidase family protein [Firmicutes bacterium ADurb.Bin182]